MALDTSAVYSASVVDELGVRAVATAYAYVDSGQTIASLNTPFSSFLLDLDAVTAGQILTGHITLRPALPPSQAAHDATHIKNAPASGSRVEQVGVFDFPAGSTNRIWGFGVPGFANAKLASGKPNLADTDVAALVTLLNTITGSPATFEWTNPEVQVLNALRDAYLAFRKHRKSLHGKSYITP